MMVGVTDTKLLRTNMTSTEIEQLIIDKEYEIKLLEQEWREARDEFTFAELNLENAESELEELQMQFSERFEDDTIYENISGD
jgi:hypothetical protein